MGQVSDQEIWDFAQKVQALPEMPANVKILVSYGRRYARIYKEWGSQNLCWGWVDKSTGDILRGGWKAPDTRVKAHRGNIRDADVLSKINWTGPEYIK